MKSILFLLLAISSFHASAFVAFCDYYPQYGNDFSNSVPFIEEVANHRFGYSKIELECTSKGQDMDIDLRTFGPGLEMTGMQGVIVSCPLVSLKRVNKVIDKKGHWAAVGAGASTGLMLGVRVGVAVNHRGALCTITGLSGVDFGTAAGAIEMRVNTKVRID